MQYEIITEILKYKQKPKYDILVIPKIRKFLTFQLNEVRIDENKYDDDDMNERAIPIPRPKEKKYMDYWDRERRSSESQKGKIKDKKRGKKTPQNSPPDDSIPDIEISDEENVPPDAIRWTNLPLDIKRKCRKFNIPAMDIKENIKILWNASEFLYPEFFQKTTDTPKPPRIPYASAELMAEAEQELVLLKKQNIKKLYGKITYTGKGGFATVVSARDLSSKKCDIVAIKKLPHTTDREKENNLCEIGILKSCNGQPNIVQYSRSWLLQPDNEVWVVTEFMHGGTLAEASRVHTFIDRHVAYVAREVLCALKYLHNKNYVHRDLKSSNIMMSIYGSIKLIDFGLCADFSNGPRINMVGSPFWIPPEMIKKESHSFKADIWSLGVCLLELSLMEPPHSVSGLKCMFMAATKGLMDQVPKTVTAEGRAFMARCLEMDPNKRASASELLEDPWTKKQGLSRGISDVLKDIFLTNTFTDLGF